MCSIYIYIYIYIALWCKNQIEHSIWDESLLFSNCARSLEYSSSSTLAGLSYHICGKLEVAFKGSPSSQHQHCIDEAQKAETVLSEVSYIYIYIYIYAVSFSLSKPTAIENRLVEALSSRNSGTGPKYKWISPLLCRECFRTTKIFDEDLSAHDLISCSVGDVITPFNCLKQT